MTDSREKTQVTIRYARPSDNVLLAEMGARTFYETFGADNTPENMAAYLAKSYGPEQQAAEIADPSMVILIAEVEGAAVGFATLRMGAREEGITGTRPMELKRIYSVQEWIGHGIGAALMQASLDEAQHRGYDSLWLSVWEHNPRAIAFYQRWGFMEVGTAIFVVGDDPQRDFLMQRLLE
jgi:GNAT superfamily N-acetyltransferase